MELTTKHCGHFRFKISLVLMIRFLPSLLDPVCKSLFDPGWPLNVIDLHTTLWSSVIIRSKRCCQIYLLKRLSSGVAIACQTALSIPSVMRHRSGPPSTCHMFWLIAVSRPRATGPHFYACCRSVEHLPLPFGS